MPKEKITLEEFLKRYAFGERNFQQIILEYADLSGVELRGIDLGGTQFNYVNLSGIKLKHCILTAQFTYCNFTNAVIENCDLGWAWFFDCDLRGATSTYTNLSSAHFTRVNLQGAKLSGSGEDPCEYWDVIRHDGVFVPGFTINLYIAERIAESKTRRKDVF